MPESGVPIDRDVRVLIVDDSPAFRAVARELVAAVTGFTLVDCLDTGEALLEWLEVRSADLVLLDVRMPGMGGLGAARALERRAPRPVVVLLSSEDQPAVAADPGAHGARSFMRKDLLSPSTLSALRPLVVPSRIAA